MTMKCFKYCLVMTAIGLTAFPAIAMAQEQQHYCLSVKIQNKKELKVEDVDPAFVESFFPLGKGIALLTPVCRIAPSGNVEYTNNDAVDITVTYSSTEFRPRIFVWNEDKGKWIGVPTEMNRQKLTARADIPDGSLFAVAADTRIAYEGIGSWYAHKRYRDGAATNLFPLGTRLKVTNLSNGKSTNVRITSTWTQKNPKRVIDLVKTAFQTIANPRAGLINVRIEKL